MINKTELIAIVADLVGRFNRGELEKRELLDLKGESNKTKSILYINMDSFDSKSECFLYINELNSLIEKINFEMDYEYKLLKKIREHAILQMGQDWADFLKKCKNGL